MPSANDILMLIGVLVAAVLLVIVVRARHRSHARHTHELALQQVCTHLQPALDLLLARGHIVLRVGQKAREMPLEIHLQPPFDPQAIYSELELTEPVLVSERNVLYCKEDWCELHPQT